MRRQLAEASGLHPNAVKYWERNPGHIRDYIVSRIVDTLESHGVSMTGEKDRRSVGHCTQGIISGRHKRRRMDFAAIVGEARASRHSASSRDFETGHGSYSGFSGQRAPTR